MPVVEKIHALCELFALIKAYITCPEEIYQEGRESFETSIIEFMRYAKTGKKTW